jgi:hypothetical protein
MPAAFYGFAALLPGFWPAMCLIAWRAKGQPFRHAPAAPGQFCLAVLLCRWYEPLKVPIERIFFPVYRDNATFIETAQQKSPKNANEENRGDYQAFQAR